MSYEKYGNYDQGVQGSDAIVPILADKLYRYLALLIPLLDQKLDKRLVTTFVNLVRVIIAFRNRAQGLLLISLGASCLPHTNPCWNQTD